MLVFLRIWNTGIVTGVLCTMQDVVCISSSVQVDDVSQLGTCVTETTTAETAPMNRTVPFPPRRQVHRVQKKWNHYIFVFNFANRQPIF